MYRVYVAANEWQEIAVQTRQLLDLVLLAAFTGEEWAPLGSFGWII